MSGATGQFGDVFVKGRYLSNLNAWSHRFSRNPRMHQSMQRGSMARAEVARPMSRGVPAELLEDSANCDLRIRVIATDEHGPRTLFIVGIEHPAGPDGIEGVHHANFGKARLQSLHR